MFSSFKSLGLTPRKGWTHLFYVVSMTCFFLYLAIYAITADFYNAIFSPYPPLLNVEETPVFILAIASAVVLLFLYLSLTARSLKLRMLVVISYAAAISFTLLALPRLVGADPELSIYGHRHDMFDVFPLVMGISIIVMWVYVFHANRARI